MWFRPGKQDASPRERALWGDLMALGMIFPIAIALGFFLGRWIGGLLGHPKVGMGVGLVWGVASGFWELYKVTLRLNRMDDADAAQRDQDRPDKGRGDGR